MSKLLEKYLYFFVFLILFSGICFSEVSQLDIIESAGTGMINYSTGRVSATGRGIPPGNVQDKAQKISMAKVAAVTAARKNLLETLKKVRIDSETIVENLDANSELIKTQINGFIENSQETAVKENPDGSVEVTVEMPLRGQVSQSLLGNMGSLIPASKTDATQTYTGLIIDCAGLGIKPAMSPKILDEGGKEIYGLSYVSEEYALKHGIVGYTKNPVAAVTNDRVGSNPIVVKGLIPNGLMQVNIIIKNSNAEHLEKINETQTFLRQCRVIFII